MFCAIFLGMQVTTARCTQVEDIGHGRLRAQLETDLAPGPGQVVLARLSPADDPYLRRPLWPVHTRPDGFALELAPGDPARPFLTPGTSVSLLGPVGRRASPPTQPPANVLLIANVHPDRLLPLAAPTLRVGGGVTLLLGRPYPIEALPPEIEIRSGHPAALISEYGGWADRVYVHFDPALPPDLTEQLRATFPHPEQVLVLLSPSMPCGTGACQACAVRLRRGWALVCRDGLLFDLMELALTADA